VKRVLVDADAFLCLRKLSLRSGKSLLDLICGSPARSSPLLLTDYIARRELNSISTEVDRLKQDGAVAVHAVGARDTTFRMLKVEVDIGEAEALAWALRQTADDRPVFVSNDGPARRAGKQHRVPCTDVMGLVVLCVESGVLTYEQAAEALEVWSDKAQELCGRRTLTDLNRPIAAVFIAPTTCECPRLSDCATRRRPAFGSAYCRRSGPPPILRSPRVPQPWGGSGAVRPCTTVRDCLRGRSETFDFLHARAWSRTVIPPLRRMAFKRSRVRLPSAAPRLQAGARMAEWSRSCDHRSRSCSRVQPLRSARFLARS